MENQNSNVDFNLDFSSDGGGQVATLESFLENDVIDKPIDKHVDDVIDSLIDDKDKVIDKPVDDITVDKPIDKPVDDITVDKPIDKPVDDVIDSLIDSGLDYKKVISKLVESKLWEGIEAFETEDGEVAFEDMNIDEDTFIQIWKQKDAETKSKLTENKVSINDMSDLTKKLIDIDKNGGDVRQALESYDTYKNPLEQLDLTDKSDQQTAIYLKLQAKGLDDKSIVDVIKAYDSSGKLEEKALEAKQDLEVAFESQMEAIKQEGIERDKIQKDALKKYKNDLSNNISKFSLKESYKKKVIDIATKPDENGKFKLDDIYSQIRQDPSKAADLVLFLTDKEEYIKQTIENEKRDINLSTMKKFKLISKGKSNVKIDVEETNKNKRFIDIEDVMK